MIKKFESWKNLLDWKGDKVEVKAKDPKETFSFTYDDLRTAFEDGGENTTYDDMYGYSSNESFEEWFDKWFSKKYK